MEKEELDLVCEIEDGVQVCIAKIKDKEEEPKDV